MKIAIAEAKAQFAEIIRRAEAGEDIELTRYGRAVARVVAVEVSVTRPLVGALAGKFVVPDMNSGDVEVAAMFGTDA